MTDVLKGVTVLELGSFITGPCAGMMLGELGADVIKIEQPKTGDPFRSFRGSLYSPQFRAYNAHKRSLTLNLREARGLEVLMKLVDRADVLLENFRPDVPEKLGFGWQALHERNPRLVYCSITGFGADGPFAEQPCYDTVAQGLSGYLSQFIDPQAPGIRGPAVADALSGMYAAYGTLGALFERAGTGRGRRVEVAMLDSMIAFSTEPFSALFANGTPPGPLTRSSGSQSFALECAEGKFIALHLSSPEKFWRNLLDAIRKPALGEDPQFANREGRIKNFAALTAALQTEFRKQPRAHWLEVLARNDVPHAPVATLDEVPHHPQVKHRGIFETMQHSTEGAVAHIRRPVLIDGERGMSATPPPALGEHTDAILRDLGYAATDVDALRRDGVV